MLTVKKIYAGRGAVDYYLNQTRRGLADYYLPQPDERASDGDGPRLSAPGSSWWGSGAQELGLSGEVERGQFVPLYAKGVHSDGGYLGNRFRQPEEAAAARAAAMRKADEIQDPYDRWMTKHEIRRTGRHASVAAWDCTFSPPKSVSLLWAAGDQEVQRHVWAAHVAAVDAGLAYLQEHAAYVRAGRNGVRVLDTGGFVVSRMNEWTSRDGDMHLHTHCLILNRAKTVEDGKWRALDGRQLLKARTGAGAIYNRTVEAELTRRLQVAWRDRPDGLRELEGVDDELIETFSSRRRAITQRVSQMAAAYRDKYGFDPPPAVLSSMGQDAWGQTRHRKRDPDPTASLERWEATARRQGRQLARLPAHVVGRTGYGPANGAPVDLRQQVLDRLTDSGRSTFTRHDLLRACLDVLPPGDDTSERLQERAEQLVSHVVARPELIGVSAPDVLDAPAELRRADGTSVYEQPKRDRWTLQATLDQEAWLLDIAPERTGHNITAEAIERAVTANDLGEDQQSAVRELLGRDERIGVLIGPAGAGKTRTLRAVVDAWQQEGGEVLGLTVSQAAADVLAAEAHVRAENTAKWLYEARRGRWQLTPGTLVLIDEASMVATRDLVELADQARRAGGCRVLLVGDPAQLSAIHIGGAFDLLADRHHATRLREVRRFTHPWERDASIQLRRRDPACLAEYAMRGRIHGDTRDEIERDLFGAWTAEAVASENAAGRRSVLMIVSTNEQAAVLSQRARNSLIDAGVVSAGRTVRLRDNVTSVGDHIVTRRNDRQLRTSNRRWVVNGDVWTVLQVHRDGAVDARRHTDGATITLPADYLADHAHLAYATTAHRAQGMTVDVCHAAITPDASHEQLYVAATRGRDANHLWVTLDADREVVRDPDDLPTPEQILSHILERRDLDRLSAHQIIEDSLTDTTSLARLGAIFEDAARTATDHWLRHALGARGLGDATDDPQWASLLAGVRQAALDGHDLPTLLDTSIRMRPINGVHYTAAVLHWRLDLLAGTTPPRTRSPLASLPPGAGPTMNIARQAGDLMRQRWRDLRASLTNATEPLPWALPLGPPPTDPEEWSSWLTAATAVTAYRERYEVPHHTAVLGPEPALSRPDAHAAWRHARHQADRHLARRLRHLTDQQLADLGARQQAIVSAAPVFDPAELKNAHRAWDFTSQASRDTAGPRGPKAPARESTHIRPAQSLERASRQHQAWRLAANEAAGIRRQIESELQRRIRHRTRGTTRMG